MKQLYKSKREEGFTIIEVLIVLAIAGLIILIVFLAVPTLQRNSRNTQRNNDASMILAGVNECLNNRNGQKSSCDSFDATELTETIDTSKLRQLTSPSVGTSVTATAQNIEDIVVIYGAKCSSDGATAQSGTARQVVAVFNTENTSGNKVARCVES